MLVFSLVTFTVSGASGQEKTAKTARTKQLPRSQPVSKPAPESQLHDSDCRAFASQVALAVRAGNVSTLNDLIDWESLFNTTMKGMDVTPKLRQRHYDGTQEWLESGNGAIGADRQEFTQEALLTF